MTPEIANLRKEYASKVLLEQEVAADAMEQFGIWWKEAIAAQIVEPNAMTLATSSSDGMPSARVVLLKDFDQQGFVFYTNYQSFKAMQLDENPRACLVFFWKELERQIRITGLVVKNSAKDSSEYFASRPEGSRIGAVASPQSQVIESRDWLDAQYHHLVKKLGGTDIHRPDHWGGYIVKPVVIEFWQGRPSRLHDRIQYTLTDEGTWKMERLAP